jgi:hypothetical protein
MRLQWQPLAPRHERDERLPMIVATRRSLVATFPPLGSGLPGRTPALLRPSGLPGGRAFWA